MEKEKNLTPDILDVEIKDGYVVTPSERIRLLAKIRGVHLKDLAKELNVNKTALFGWLSNKDIPPFNRLGEIADYFDVDVRYLVTGKHEVRYSEIPEETREMIKKYNELSEVRKSEIREYINHLLEAEKSDKQQFKIKWQQDRQE